MSGQPDALLRERVASCPGYETDPNPCRCPCYGCERACSAHDPADGLTPPVVPLRRCPSCEHGAKYHDTSGRCWFTVEQAVPGRSAVCSCLLRHPTTPDEQDPHA